jgi:hypothetical protein
MNIVAGEPVRGPKFGDALAKQTLFWLQPLGIAIVGPSCVRKRFTSADIDVPFRAAIM